MYLKSAFNKYRSSPVQMKASLWYAICNILQKGISFIVIPIYVRLLTTSEYGHYSVFISWKDIIIIFATLNLYCGVFTKAIVDYKNDRDRYTSCMQGLSTVITIIVFFYLFAYRSILGNAFRCFFPCYAAAICLFHFLSGFLFLVSPTEGRKQVSENGLCYTAYRYCNPCIEHCLVIYDRFEGICGYIGILDHSVRNGVYFLHLSIL